MSLAVAAPAEVVWDDLVDLTAWPSWGPTVRSARLDDGGTLLGAEATGSLVTTLGVPLRFEVDGWCGAGARRSWSWRVAGVRATGHGVVETGPEACRVWMSVPWWAPAYLGVVAPALVRLRRRAESRAGTGGR